MNFKELIYKIYYKIINFNNGLFIYLKMSAEYTHNGNNNIIQS